MLQLARAVEEELAVEQLHSPQTIIRSQLATDTFSSAYPRGVYWSSPNSPHSCKHT